jgi:hypothetical protein
MKSSGVKSIDIERSVAGDDWALKILNNNRRIVVDDSELHDFLEVAKDGSYAFCKITYDRLIRWFLIAIIPEDLMPESAGRPRFTRRLEQKNYYPKYSSAVT